MSHAQLAGSPANVAFRPSSCNPEQVRLPHREPCAEDIPACASIPSPRTDSLLGALNDPGFGRWIAGHRTYSWIAADIDCNTDVCALSILGCAESFEQVETCAEDRRMFLRAMREWLARRWKGAVENALVRCDGREDWQDPLDCHDLGPLSDDREAP